LSLLLLVICLVDDDGQTPTLFGVQVLGRAVDVVGDDRPGYVEDGLGRAIVLLQKDDPGVRIVVSKTVYVTEVGATEGIDGVMDYDAIGHIVVQVLHVKIINFALVVEPVDFSDYIINDFPIVTPNWYHHRWVNVAGRLQLIFKRAASLNISKKSPNDDL
jgi:hypothetical protein